MCNYFSLKIWSVQVTGLHAIRVSKQKGPCVWTHTNVKTGKRGGGTRMRALKTLAPPSKGRANPPPFHDNVVSGLHKCHGVKVQSLRRLCY